MVAGKRPIQMKCMGGWNQDESQVSVKMTKSSPKRWQQYFMKHGTEFTSFWNKYLKQKRDILYILGWGFDPRMCVGLEEILNAGGIGSRHCWIIDYHEGFNSSGRHVELLQSNKQHFDRLVTDPIKVVEKKISATTESAAEWI